MHTSEVHDGETKWMYFLIGDDELFKKYIWNDVSNSIKEEFDSEPIYNKKFLKTKIKSYGDEATHFHDKEIPKEGSEYTCLAVITIDYVLKKDENYYPQVFLKECKYIEKEKKLEILMTKKIHQKISMSLIKNKLKVNITIIWCMHQMWGRL